MKINFTNLKELFFKEVSQEINKHKPLKPEIITEERISHLPEPVKKHFRVTGMIGQQDTLNAKITWGGVKMHLKKGQPWIDMDRVLQFNSVPDPARIINLKAKLSGLFPFEGRDKYQDGIGHMLIKALGVSVVEDVKGQKMNESALVTVLAEALFLPSLALQDYIKWEAIDSKSAKATLTDKGISVSGIFNFNDEGIFHFFYTNDRWQKDEDEKTTAWAAYVDRYKNPAGILYPYFVTAAWHEGEEVNEYYRGFIEKVEFNIDKF